MKTYTTTDIKHLTAAYNHLQSLHRSLSKRFIPGKSNSTNEQVSVRLLVHSVMLQTLTLLRTHENTGKNSKS